MLDDTSQGRSGARAYSRILTILLVVLTSVLGWRLWSLSRQYAGGSAAKGEDATAERPVTPRGDLAADEKSTIELFRSASPSVVYITSLAVQRDLITMDLEQTPKGTGSGFIWDKQGHVVTNFHVIMDASGARVTLQDHSVWEAKLVGVSSDKDLAVLRIDAPAALLTPIPVGRSEDLLVGQKVFAIGDPFGLDQTLTTGVISAIGREIRSVSGRPIQGVVQTDAAINPGNSGGPLLDSAGRLIGVNTQIISPSGAYAGIGFAVPVDTVNRIVPQLIQFGKVVRPGLGIRIAEDQLARRFGVKEGALVQEVNAGSAAALAGIQPIQRDARGRLVVGDVVVAVDGREVKTSNDVYRALDVRKVGDEITVTVRRGTAVLDTRVVLQAIN